MNPKKHVYLDRWLNRMLQYSDKYWKTTIPKFNLLRHTNKWNGEDAPYLMPIKEKVDELRSEIRKQLNNLNGPWEKINLKNAEEDEKQDIVNEDVENEEKNNDGL